MKSNLSLTNKYILFMVWAQPVLVLVFSLYIYIVFPNTNHFFLLSKILLFSIGFSAMVSYTYRKIKVVGIAFAISIFPFFIFAFLPKQSIVFYWFILVLFITVEIKNLRFKNSIKNTSLLLFCTIVLIIVQIPYFSLEYSQPFNEYKLTLGEVHIDTLYHVSISSMFKNYQAISHGLHGLGELNYHIGSHIIFAGVSNILKISVFESYNYFFVFFCIPWLAIILIAVSEELIPSFKLQNFLSKLISYIFIIICTGIFIKGSVLNLFVLWPSFYESESYVVSLLIFFSLISILLKYRMHSSHRLLFIIMFLILFIFLTLTKISTGFMGLILIGFWSLMNSNLDVRNNKFYKFIIPSFFLIIFLVILFLFVNPGLSDANFNPLWFFKTYVKYPIGSYLLRLVFFIFAHFIFSIIAIVMLSLIIMFFKKNAIIPIWYYFSIIGTFVFGCSLLLLYESIGGGFYYFSNLAMFTSLPVTISVWILFKRIYCNLKVKRSFKKIIILIIYSFTLIFLIYGFRLYGVDTILSGFKIFSFYMKKNLTKSALSPYVEKLKLIRDDSETLDSLIYISKGENDYWNSIYCKGTGFFISAISERPALYAWPSKECYDFLCGPRFHSEGLCDLSQKKFKEIELLIETKKLGFNKLIIISKEKVQVIY